MYRIMMPNGRMVETHEIIFVKSDKEHMLAAINVDYANGIVFKSEAGTYWWISGANMDGAFGTGLGATWSSLLTKGYAGFSRHQYNGYIKANRVTAETYMKLLCSMEDISNTDNKE